MVISCNVCHRPLCELEPLELQPAEVSIMKRTLGGFLGIDLSAALPKLDVILHPTAENIATTFNVRHIGCANGKS